MGCGTDEAADDGADRARASAGAGASARGGAAGGGAAGAGAAGKGSFAGTAGKNAAGGGGAAGKAGSAGAPAAGGTTSAGGSVAAGGTTAAGGSGAGGSGTGGTVAAGGSEAGGSEAGGSEAGGAPTTGGTIDDAVVVAHSLPTQLACSQHTNVSVTVRNIGDSIWTDAGGYRLGAVDDTDPLFVAGNRVYLAPGESVAPGQEHTFSLELAAGIAGSFTTDWRMVHDGVQWFGGIAAQDVKVSCDVTSAVYPCIIDGQFSMPEHDQRIASRNAALLKTGHVITGDDAVDNATLGGGSPDGGIWLSGQFHFEIDAGGQAIAASSWIAVFSPEHNPVTGGVYPNGEIHMGSPAGLDISGLISGGVVTGFVAEAGNYVTTGDTVWNALSSVDRGNLRGIRSGNDLEFVHGLMSGTSTP